MEGRGDFFPFPSLHFPGLTSGSLHPQLLFNHDKWSNFFKSIRSVVRKVRCEGFLLSQQSSCSVVRGCPFPACCCYFLLHKWDQLCLAQQADSQNILSMMGGFCTRFEWCGLQQISFHSSQKENIRCGDLLPRTALIYADVARNCVFLKLVTVILLSCSCMTVFFGGAVMFNPCFCLCLMCKCKEKTCACTQDTEQVFVVRCGQEPPLLAAVLLVLLKSL